LIDIILGLLRPIEGAILVDGEYSVNSPQWHQFIGYVPQSIYLVDDTIEANIVFGEKPENIDFDRL
jgi:ATP-binding cassette subfamily C protein